MTDITELAQNHELRNKVNHRLYAALEFQGTSGEHATITLSIDECKSIIAAMDERLALVEALEKAQQRIDSQREYYEGVIADGGKRIAELEEAEQKLCAANITLDARAELAERQLAELDSRTVTVKLPTTRLWAGVTECYEKSDVIAAIRSAGMEVSDD